MQREGVFREMKRRRFYEKPSEQATREKAEAARRARKLARKQAIREGLIAAPKKSKHRFAKAPQRSLCMRIPIDRNEVIRCDSLSLNQIQMLVCERSPATWRDASCPINSGPGDRLVPSDRDRSPLQSLPRYDRNGNPRSWLSTLAP